MPSAATLAKARRLTEADAVHEIDARAFSVRGDHSLYVVVLANSGRDTCTCPAYGECSHVIAARELAEEAR